MTARSGDDDHDENMWINVRDVSTFLGGSVRNGVPIYVERILFSSPGNLG